MVHILPCLLFEERKILGEESFVGQTTGIPILLCGMIIKTVREKEKGLVGGRSWSEKNLVKYDSTFRALRELGCK